MNFQEKKHFKKTSYMISNINKYLTETYNDNFNILRSFMYASWND